MNIRLLGFLLGFAACASAQIDGAKFAADLRQKYGPALAREAFTARPGLNIIVDFAANGHVCRILLPAMAPTGEAGAQSAKAIDDFVDELVPVSVRGKELRKFGMAAGAPMAWIVEYENVSVVVASQGADRTGTTVTFTNEQCQ